MFVSYSPPFWNQARTTCLGAPAGNAARQIINPQVLHVLPASCWIVVNLQRPDYCFVA